MNYELNRNSERIPLYFLNSATPSINHWKRCIYFFMCDRVDYLNTLNFVRFLTVIEHVSTCRFFADNLSEVFYSFEKFRGERCTGFDLDGYEFSIPAKDQINLVVMRIPVKIHVRTEPLVQVMLKYFENNQIFIKPAAQRVAHYLIRAVDIEQMCGQASIDKVNFGGFYDPFTNVLEKWR